MEIGMLWFDDDLRRSLEDRVARAVAHYSAKYGARPTVCYVHPSQLSADTTCAGVRVRSDRAVLLNHLWLGIGELVDA